MAAPTDWGSVFDDGTHKCVPYNVAMCFALFVFKQKPLEKLTRFAIAPFSPKNNSIFRGPFGNFFEVADAQYAPLRVCLASMWREEQAPPLRLG